MNNYLKQLLGTISLLLLSTNNPLSAQVIPDATLPNNSIVIPQNNNFRIEGGSNSGSNLFHSFSEFSVPTGGEAFFNNAQNIQNIFSRVTGRNISNIDGLIRANGTANLFLINPNGIIFGQNSQLNIGGSFLGSTANSIKFADGNEFSATNPTAPSLLTINVPVGLQFGSNPGSIVNRSQATAQINLPTLLIPLPFDNKVGLAVAPGQTLALVGGDIQLNGGNLTASTGQIILGSVTSPSLVSLAPTPFGLSLNYDNVSNFGNIQISNGSIVNTTGIGGGKVDIKGGNILLIGGRIYAITLGNIDGRGININARNFQVENGSQIFTQTLGTGKGGSVNISAIDSVELSGIGFDSFQNLVLQFARGGLVNPFDLQFLIITGTAGSGTAGNIIIDTGRLLIENGSVISSSTAGSGNGGDITIRARVFDLVGSGINTGPIISSTGTGGNITFEGKRLVVRDGAALVSQTRTNTASGNINIQASESVEILRTPDGSIQPTFIGTTTIGQNGKAGDINIDTKRLIISDGAGISAATGAIIANQLFGTNGGLGGNIIIRSSESIDIAGISGVVAVGVQIGSFLNTETVSSNRGGDIHISTGVLTLGKGGSISSSSLGAADAGNIAIDAARIELLGNNLSQFKSQILASVGVTPGFTNPNATANAGSLNLNTNQLILRNGSSVGVRSFGIGDAGNINVVANTLVLDNQSTIDGTTVSGAGANINLQVRDMQLRRNSGIGTDAANATGGNITINTNTLVALENSDITANAAQGSGGKVSITAQGIFGTQFRDGLTPQSDLTATSDLGPQFSGIVEINTPDVNSTASLIELNTNFTDISNQIVAGCQASRRNSFVITGTGGLPEDPTQTLKGQTVWRDLRAFGEIGRWGDRENNLTTSSTPPTSRLPYLPTSSSQSPIIEATGWKTNQFGQVELVANSTNGIGSWNNEMGCNTSRPLQ